MSLFLGERDGSKVTGSLKSFVHVGVKRKKKPLVVIQCGPVCRDWGCPVVCRECHAQQSVRARVVAMWGDLRTELQ